MIISVIGSGGKTTYIRELKDKYVSMNKTVLMCTTTHMLIEEDTLVDPGYDEIMQRIETYGYCHAGNRCGDLKIGALDEELFNQLKQVVDVILIDISAGVCALISKPMGACTFDTSSLEYPSSIKASKVFFTFPLLPIIPKYK